MCNIHKVRLDRKHFTEVSLRAGRKKRSNSSSTNKDRKMFWVVSQTAGERCMEQEAKKDTTKII